MEIIWSDDIDKILSVGYSLNKIGIRNWALDRRLSLISLSKLFDIKIAILGGDVYKINGDEIEPSYDNWCCNRRNEEDYIDFVNRSIVESKNYINKYPNPYSIFSFVPNNSN